MKITVSPIPKGSIDREMQDQQLKKFADRHCDNIYKIDEPKRKSKPSLESQRALRRKVIKCFDEIGYNPIFGGEGGMICFKSSVAGGMKDLVFSGFNEAKDWLVKAECWK